MTKPTNKQLQKIVNRILFYDWTEFELTELVRRMRKMKPSAVYVSGCRVAVESAPSEEQERLKKFMVQIEKDAGEVESRIISLN